MALLRLIHAAEMPDPARCWPRCWPAEEQWRLHRRAPAAAPARRAQASLPLDFPALVDAVERQGKQLLGVQLRDHVGLVSFAPGELVLKPLKPLGADFVARACRRGQAGDRRRAGRSG